MNQTILFTPIGGTDPISSTNCRDGSMLHICRMYKPNKVIMYMSKEMLDYQKQDDRYRYCLGKLAEQQERDIECEIIERKELTNVHEFDYFYQDFRTIISEIYETMDESDTLLLNVSSGTPAMKSGLLVLQTLGEFPAKVIQVTTPEKKINEHIHKDYDVELLWELNEDNGADCENRCKEVKCPTLSKIKKEEIIKKHILAYDYKAALDVADTLDCTDTVEYRDLIYMASRRLLLDFTGVDLMIRKTGVECIPIRSSSDRKYFEYALNMGIRLKKGEYVDFVRSITPIIVDLFELILKKQCHLKVEDYCDINIVNEKQVLCWSPSKMKDTEIEDILNKEYKEKGGFKGKNIYSVHLKTLIEKLSNDPTLIKFVQDIRLVEEKIRNLAAHEIISVTDDTIKEMTGFSGEKIMDMIQKLFVYTGIPIKKEYWNSYEEMNNKILEKIQD